MSEENQEVEQQVDIEQQNDEAQPVELNLVIDEQEENTQPAPAWVRELRKQHRETAKQLKEAQRELEEYKKPKASVLGEKPTLESCDYDAEVFEQNLAEWYDKKRKHDSEVEKREKQERAQAEEWNARLAFYNDEKAKLNAPDLEEAEGMAKAILDVAQQGIVIHAAKNPALVAYGLGKNLATAERLAAIKDPIRFAVEMAHFEKRLEEEMAKTRKPATAPEKKVEGFGTKSGAVDSTLDKLREEAAKTGDYSKVVAYNRAKRS